MKEIKYAPERAGSAIKVAAQVQYLHKCRLWQYRLWSFQGRDTKFEMFLAKHQLLTNEII